MSCDTTHTWQGIHVYDYGWVGKLVCKQDGVVEDISTYTTRKYIFLSPLGVVKTVDVDFDTDGANGVLVYTVQDGDIDEVGEWSVQARISKAGAEVTSSRLAFKVESRIG